MFRKIFIFAFVSLGILLPTKVLAADLDIYCYENQKPVIVQNSTPLFNLSGFMPGEKEVRSIYMKNYDSNNSCRIYVDANGSQNILTDNIEVSLSDTFKDSLSSFLSIGKILLVEINPSSEVTKQMTLLFESKLGNDYQDKKASFDLIITSQWGGDQINNQENEGQVQGEQTKNVILNPEEVREIVVKDDGEILGVEKTCKKSTLWWIPIVIQLLLTVIILFIKKLKITVKFIITVSLGIISYFVINWIGCGCNPIWICENHWILNLVISGLPTITYLFKK